MKILNLFAGLGGNRIAFEGHEVTAVEYNSDIAAIYQSRFPKDIVIITDAYDYIQDHYLDFDFIWASPECTTHSKNNCRPSIKKRLPDLRLYSLIIFLQAFAKDKIWIVENVQPYYSYLIKPTAVIDRHAYWSNKLLQSHKKLTPTLTTNYIGSDHKQHNGGLSDMSLQQLSDYHHIPLSVFENTTHIDKRKCLRNCVHFNVAQNIMKQLCTQIQKTNVF